MSFHFKTFLKINQIFPNENPSSFTASRICASSFLEKKFCTALTSFCGTTSEGFLLVSGSPTSPNASNSSITRLNCFVRQIRWTFYLKLDSKCSSDKSCVFLSLETFLQSKSSDLAKMDSLGQALFKTAVADFFKVFSRIIKCHSVINNISLNEFL